MVASMIRWPWPPILSRKFGVRLVLRGIEGFPASEAAGRMIAEVRWKGPKTTALRSLRRTVKRNCTREEAVKGDKGEVEWNEDFENVVTLTAYKENAFNPWEIEIVVFNGLKQGPKNKASIVGMASLNLAEYAPSPGEELELNLPLFLLCSTAKFQPLIHLSLKLLELRTSSAAPASSSPSLRATLPDKDELSALRAGLRKVKIFKEFVSSRKPRKTVGYDEGSDGRFSARSEDIDYIYPFDTDSLDDDDSNDELEPRKDDASIRKSISYGTLAAANYLGGAFNCDFKTNEDYEDFIYYSHPSSERSVEEDKQSIPEQSLPQTTKRSILPWKKRKYGFKSKAKGEPLLKKAYGEEGGDDIDHDRRQLTSSDESLTKMGYKTDDGSTHYSSISDFGDDSFSIGSWEPKAIISRCGQMKLSTQVFFASIDQRSGRADGESACTALVAVMADWFQSNQNTMPIKSQLDSLIREGSFEWRNLCKDPAYRVRFPDKHFDLETVLQAKIRPLSVVPSKSFIGFFHPEGCEDISGFEFLHGAMSFDSIWEEISQCGSDCLFIVSWNDHFFVLKVERDAYYIIDTLGERLYEGCDQAYILKFDDSTSIHKIPSEKESSTDVPGGLSGEESHQHNTAADDEDLVCKGKESCKEYIKSFLAAIPIRELQADIKKGLKASAPLHHRLQIEFNYTEASKDLSNLATFWTPPSWGSPTRFSVLQSHQQ